MKLMRKASRKNFTLSLILGASCCLTNGFAYQSSSGMSSHLRPLSLEPRTRLSCMTLKSSLDTFLCGCVHDAPAEQHPHAHSTHILGRGPLTGSQTRPLPPPLLCLLVLLLLSPPPLFLSLLYGVLRCDPPPPLLDFSCCNAAFCAAAASFACCSMRRSRLRSATFEVSSDGSMFSNQSCTRSAYSPLDRTVSWLIWVWNVGTGIATSTPFASRTPSAICSKTSRSCSFRFVICSRVATSFGPTLRLSVCSRRSARTVSSFFWSVLSGMMDMR
mmetsp:Transcript_5676/g.14157  ORF Transcript_5676/g.14157 Transcript_5676/m.14157 type:complete len:273 (-) Transcript_5676:440-1258(-)